MAEKYKVKLGKSGTVTLPESMRKRFGLREGKDIVIESHRDGILIKPPWMDLLDMEDYTDERTAEFLLTNSIGEEEYQRMRKEVANMGLDPDKILHIKPDGTLVKGVE